MKKYFLFLIVSLISYTAFSQYYGDAAQDSIMNNDCDCRIFTKMEQPPSIKNGIEVLADSIALFLKKKSVFSYNYSGQVKFVVTSKSRIVSFTIISGNMPDKGKNIKKAVERFADMWIPAKQNGYTVCAYITLSIEKAQDAPNLLLSVIN